VELLGRRVERGHRLGAPRQLVAVLVGKPAACEEGADSVEVTGVDALAVLAEQGADAVAVAEHGSQHRTSTP
jgi:hypothetical protein